MAVVLLMSIYQSSLLTHLLNPPTANPFKGTDDLLAKIGNREMNLVLSDDSDWYAGESIVHIQSIGKTLCS